MKLLDTLRTLLDMAPERARLEPESAAYPQLHLPLWRGREKHAPILVLLLGGPLNRRRCVVSDPFDPDIHITVRRSPLWQAGKVGERLTGPVLVPVTYWYRMRRVPLEGFSMHRTAYYVGVVGEVAALFGPDAIVP